jgi:hypothetical protein
MPRPAAHGATIALNQPISPLIAQLLELLILAIPIACIARTVVFEEVFREPREWCKSRSQKCNQLLKRKFFYLFTCEYCFSHYIAAVILLVTRFKLLFDDWRGYLISFFSLVFVANCYLNFYGRLRLEIQHAKAETKVIENEVEQSAATKPSDGKRREREPTRAR